MQGTVTAAPSARLIHSTVLLAGIGTLGIEMVMPRLLAPFFGTSQPIWAVVIGLTLFYLAIGYHLGGRMADRRPDPALLFRLIGWAGLATAFVPLLSRPVLTLAQSALGAVAAGGFIAALLGVLLLFAVPVTLLAAVGPFAVKLRLLQASDVAEAGRISGTISALSTVGSIGGTFLTVLVLIPAFGSSVTLYLFAAFLLVLSMVGLRDPRGLLNLAAIVVLALVQQFAVPTIRRADCYACRLISEQESAYNYIQVAEQTITYNSGYEDRRHVLLLNEGLALHSIHRLKYRETGDPLDLLTDGGPWDYFTIAPYVYPQMNEGEIDSLLMLGSAAGTVPQQFLAIYGSDSVIDAVEIDPAISAVGRQYFDLADASDSAPNYRVYDADARAWLATTDRQYDVIGMDAYHQPYIPFHLTTVEFFREVRARLTQRGVAVVNAGRPESGDERLVNALASTMLEVFPQVFVIDTRFSNALLIGVNAPVGDATLNFIDNADRLQTQALQLVAYWAMNEGRYGPLREFTREQAATQPFTDDHAPVELLIDGLIVSEAQAVVRP